MEKGFQNLSKQERRELRREEKLTAHETSGKKRFAGKIFIWCVILILIGGFVYWLILPEKNRPGESFEVQGREHIEINALHIPYNSNPPTSGPHYAQPADWGVYQKELPDEQLVHNLEHGGIWISYKDIDEDTKAKLEAIGSRYSKSVIITPRSKNDTKIAVASWGRLQKFEQYDEQSIIKFIKANKNKSPEALAR